MVRNMVGTLVEIGRGERRPGDVPRALAARNRAAVGRMAPACGLFLEAVTYPEHTLDPAWRDPDAPRDEEFRNSGQTDTLPAEPEPDAGPDGPRSEP